MSRSEMPDSITAFYISPHRIRLHIENKKVPGPLPGTTQTSRPNHMHAKHY